MKFKRLADIGVEGKRVLIREDLNVPIADGEITSDARIRAALPTIEQCVAQGAAVIVMSHLGRPEEGVYDDALSLAPIGAYLSEALGQQVDVVRNWRDGLAVDPGRVVLMDNVRFEVGEKANSDDLAREYAALCDVFVMDAFATAHRAQASTHGVAKYAETACAGPLLAAELDALARALEQPARPVVAIVGGSKVSTKLAVLGQLAEMADHIVVGGGIANTFLLAAGKAVGASLCEPDLEETARDIADKVNIPLPVDVMVTDSLNADAVATLRPVDEVNDAELIADIGPRSARQLADVLTGAGTIIWNGPLGVFEIDQFGEGTRVVAEAIAESPAFSIAGGGDTLAAIDKYGVRDGISYISTGGGAFLEFVEGKVLPAAEILESRA